MNLDIAIVGMNCRFPGADDLDGYWRLIAEGREGITRFNREDLIGAGVAETRVVDPDLVPAAGVLDGARFFDAAFFGYSTADAVRIDPQQRMFLQACWHAMEDSGHRPEGRVGVYAGQTLATHRVLDPSSFLGTSADLLSATDDKDFLPTRVAYKLGLTGPGIAVQSACSTSLVAVHLACQGLLTFDCDTALAGGVSWTPLRRFGYLRQEGGVWSVDGHMRPFDAAASGFVPSDGLGVVVLRRLADALADGDRVYAVIKGSAVNNDGHTKQSWVAPSVDGQRRVIVDALSAAGVHPDSIGYVEAHGTATPLGDAVEVAALTAGYRDAGGTGRSRCALGSVKANIGHTDAAAGVAGLIKVALALHHGVRPPLAHFRTPNPEIDFTAFDPAACGDWTGLRRAAVSAFGIGGTNAHLVLEQAPVREGGGPSRAWTPVVLSAREPRVLRELAGRCADELDRSPLADIAHTLATGRVAFNHRVGGVFADPGSAAAALSGFAQGTVVLAGGDAAKAPGRLAFLFPGGGARPAEACRALSAAEPLFRASVEECLAVAAPDVAARIRALLAGDADEDDPRHALPTLFTAETALAHLLMSLGVRSDVLLGHSVGEYAAAHLAGVFTLPDALAVVAERADILASAADGAMLSVAATPADLEPFLARGVSLAAVNGRAQCVLAGTTDRISVLAADLERCGIDARVLPLRTAAHSALVEPELPRFRRFLDGIPLRRPMLPLVSASLGRAVTAEVTDPDYWVTHLRGTVRFADALDALPDTAFVEVGPGAGLTGLVRAHCPDAVVAGAGRHTRDGRTDQVAVLEALVALWTAGLDVDPAAWHSGERRLKAPIAAYPFAATPMPEPVLTPAAPARSGVLHGVGWRRAVDATRPGRADRDWLVRSDGSALATRVAELVPTGRSGTKPLRVLDFRAGELGLASLVELACMDADMPVEVLLVTRGALAVTGAERLAPDQACALGAGLVLDIEHPAVEVRIADVDESDVDGCARMLTAEFDRPRATPVAYRNGHRWMREFQPVDSVPGGLRDQGVYLVTGGFGALGAAVAEHLAKTCRARLVLVGRTAPRNDLVKRLRGLGADVLAHTGDVADSAVVRRLLALTRERFGRVDGVVHAAGVPGGGVLQNLAPAAVEEALRAKVAGTRVLVDAVRDDPPDFVVLFSSIASLRGAPGLACYAAANAFLDTFAVHATRVLGVPTLSLNWDRWRGMGMAEEVERRHRAITGSDLLDGLDPAEAIAAFDAALGLVHLGQVVVTPNDPDAPPPVPALEALRPVAGRPALPTEYAPATTATQRALVTAWEATLGVDGIGVHDNFFDLGGDSLVAIRSVRRCSDALGVPVTVRALFVAPTVAGLARAVEDSDG